MAAQRRCQSPQSTGERDDRRVFITVSASQNQTTFVTGCRGRKTRLTARPIMNVRNVLFRRKCAAFGAWASYGHDRLWFRKYYRQCCANFADYQILFFNAMSSILYHFFAGSCLYFHWCADIRIVVMLYTWRILFLLVLHMLIASDWSVHLNKFNKSYCT